MNSEIIDIVRQIVNNKGYKTNIQGNEQTLDFLIVRKFANRDAFGATLNNGFVDEYNQILIQNGFTKYELRIIKDGPYGLVYFENDLIQFFINNPKFKFIWDGYREHIINADVKSSLQIYIENLCLAYDLKKQGPIISIFLKDLIVDHNKTFLEFLQYFEILNHNHLIFHPYNYKELIEGIWLQKEEDDIYRAILNGMKVVNEIFIKKYNESFFINIPELNQLNYFRPIFFPTKLNFYLYIMELFILFHDNICRNTLKKLTGEKGKNGPHELIEIYTAKYNLDIKIQRKFKETLKKISDIRNISAHELYENTYEEIFWRQQDDLNKQLYIFLNVIIKNEISDFPYSLKEYNGLFGTNGKISLWNGFNIPPYNFYDKQICAVCEKFDQRDAEILIAFKNKKI